MKILKTISSFLMVMCIPLFLSSCSSDENKLEKIKERGELILGTSADYAPYEFPIRDENGNEKIVGFDIDIAEEIAKDMGVKLTIKNMDFSGLLDALKSNSVDIILSGIAPTETRRQSIDFSDIYYKAKTVVLTSKEKANSIKSLDDLKGLNIGVQLGSIQDKLAQEKLKGANIKSLLRIPELILELLSNKVDVVITEAPVAEQYINKNPDLVMVELDEFNEQPGLGSAVGIKKNQPDLVNQVNKTIKRLIEEDKINEFYSNAVSTFEKLNNNN